MFEKNMLTVYLPDCAGEKTGLERASMVSPCQRWGHNQAWWNSDYTSALLGAAQDHGHVSSAHSAAPLL